MKHQINPNRGLFNNINDLYSSKQYYERQRLGTHSRLKENKSHKNEIQDPELDSEPGEKIL